MAVRLALGETHVVAETKRALGEAGAWRGGGGGGERGGVWRAGRWLDAREPGRAAWTGRVSAYLACVHACATPPAAVL